jgi:hypothetical protein
MPSPDHLTPWSDRRHRHRRDRIRHECPNCGACAYAKPDFALVCGQCCLTLQEVRPAGYPAVSQGRTIVNRPKVQPADLPLEDLALPPHIRVVVEHALTTPPAMPQAPVVITPAEQPTRTRKAKPAKANPELESAAEHCRLWLDHWSGELQALSRRDQVQRYLRDLAAAGDQVFLVNGWNRRVAPVFGITDEAVRLSKKAWQAQQTAQLEAAA